MLTLDSFWTWWYNENCTLYKPSFILFHPGPQSQDLSSRYYSIFTSITIIIIFLHSVKLLDYDWTRKVQVIQILRIITRRFRGPLSVKRCLSKITPRVRYVTGRLQNSTRRYSKLFIRLTKTKHGFLSSGPIHTNPDKFQNAPCFVPFDLLSTPKHRFLPPKTDPFENVFLSGFIWKRLLGVFLWTAKTELIENADVTTVMWALSRINPKSLGNWRLCWFLCSGSWFLSLELNVSLYNLYVIIQRGRQNTLSSKPS